MGWERKVRRCGQTLASLWAGVAVIIAFRMVVKASLGPPSASEGVGKFDMVVVWSQDASTKMLSVRVHASMHLGIVTGNPGVFQGYPDLHLVKTHTQSQGMGFTRSGYGYLSGYTVMRQVKWVSANC